MTPGMPEQEASGVIEEISPEDDMYGFLKSHAVKHSELDEETARARARAAYFQQAQSALESIELALLAARKEEVRRILDFGCGHGRVLRMIKAAFPEAHLTACDIERGAVDFCAETLGAAPVYSREDPEEIGLQEANFDLIWCGSLLTHLDRARWNGFISLFDSLLGSQGVLVFTTHGRAAAKRLRTGRIDYSSLDKAEVDHLVDDFESTGFAYRDFPHLNDYGTSLASPSWICSWLERQSRLRLVLFTEKGWDNHQDVIACIRDDE
jgi:SAM-dependent methyltransferase